MWRPPIHFVSLHYAYIILMSLLAIPILYPAGNISVINAYHFGVSVSTESGLNTVDLKELKTYQQLYLYFAPTLTNLGFVNILVVVVRLWWFRKHLKKLAPALFEAKRRQVADNGAINEDTEAGLKTRDHPDEATQATPSASKTADPRGTVATQARDATSTESEAEDEAPPSRKGNTAPENPKRPEVEQVQEPEKSPLPQTTRIKFDANVDAHPKNDVTLYIPGPRDRDRGDPLIELDRKYSVSRDRSIHDRDLDAITPVLSASRPSLRRRRTDGLRLVEAKSLDRVATVASSVFVLGGEKKPPERRPSVSSQSQPALNDKPFLSRQVTIGRNSQFQNMTSEDRDALGGIEYRSLKLLLKIVLAYFFGLHLFGAICLVPWIKRADPKYREYLREIAQGDVWWAFYSSQTMVNNLGLTLTPDSMISFRDAEWPMFIMSFLAFAGHTFYPVFLRLCIWTMSKILPRSSPTQDPLHFLLDHPRRCYTLLFPSGPTWVLFAILFALNSIDTLLIIVLDLNNPEVSSLPLGKRFLAALFQAASARHTGTSTFSLSQVNPAVQLSLLVMMYISIFPIAISIRASNTYEERALGIYPSEEQVDESGSTGRGYLLKHMQNQLSFDLWYIFLGIFCVAIAEADRIMDPDQPAFNLFSVFFEVTSAYGNVGLSLGHPDANVSLCGMFSTFSKVVICLIMIRGRHRGLPYQLDRAIMLPDEHLVERAADSSE